MVVVVVVYVVVLVLAMAAVVAVLVVRERGGDHVLLVLRSHKYNKRYITHTQNGITEHVECADIDNEHD